jgi:hypothetical protein
MPGIANTGLCQFETFGSPKFDFTPYLSLVLAEI